MTTSPIQSYFPTGPEIPADPNVILKINPKHHVPQYFFADDCLADPCFAIAEITSQFAKSQKDLFPLAEPNRTSNLLFVSVTPRVLVWVRWVAKQSKNANAFRDFQKAVLSGNLIESYLKARFSADAIASGVADAEKYLAGGGRGNGLLPEPEPGFRDVIRFTNGGKWDGYEKWCERIGAVTVEDDTKEEVVEKKEPASRKAKKPARYGNKDSGSKLFQ